MKILYVSPTFPIPPNDGGKIVIYNTYKSLKRLGMEITFIALSKSKVMSEDISEMDGINNSEVFIDKRISSIWRIVRSFISNQPYLMDKFYSKVFMKRLLCLVSEKEYDVIHFEGLHTARYAIKILKTTNTKIVIRFHNIESQIVQRYSSYTRTKLFKILFTYELKKIKKLEDKCYNELKNVVFISREDYQTAISERNPKFNPYISPSGVDLKFFNPSLSKSTIDLLFLGSMDWKPNEDAVLWFYENVFVHLQKKYPTLLFYIVGKNPSSKVLRLSSNNVIITGIVDDVRPYIHKTGISVIPIRIGGGMRVKLLELMSSEKAIVSTSIGAEGVEIKHGENIFIADSAEEFIEKISYLIENPSDRRRLGQNARKQVENHYSWDSIILDLIKYYDSIVDDK